MAKKLANRNHQKPQGQKPPWLSVQIVDRGGRPIIGAKLGDPNNLANSEVVEMVIAGTIGSSWYDDSGATSKEFREKFNLVPRGTRVHVRINSEGGSVQDALEIYNLIQRAVKEGREVITFNDGYALSSASFILCAGSKVIAPASSITMIHEPWSMTMGDAEDHTRSAAMLDKHGDTIAQIYARKTGLPASDMRDKMRDETWMTGAELMDFGMSDAMTVDAACPSCQHEQTSGDETLDGSITCSECGQTHAAEEWEETQEEELLEDSRNRFDGLDLTPFKNVPKAVLNLIRAGQLELPKRTFTPAMASNQNQTTPIMRKKIIALLKKNGITVADDATDAWLEAEMDKLQNAAPPAVPVGAVSAAEFARVEAQLKQEKRTRIKAEVVRRGENRIANEDIEFWVDSAMSDEANTLLRIDRMNVNRPGGEPIGGTVSVVQSRMQEIRKEPMAHKRFEMLKNEWEGLIADAFARDARGERPSFAPAGHGNRNLPVAANTYSATLITAFLIDGAATKLQNRWAPLVAFTRDYSQDKYKPRATGELKFASASGTTQKNAANFETSGDATVDPITIAVDQYTTGLHVTNDELNSGLRMENLLNIKIAECADNLLKVAFSPLATGSFTTNPKIISAAAAFGWNEMATASGSLKKSSIKYAILDGEYVARIENTPSFFQATGTMNGGFDGWKRFGWDGVYTNTNWSGTHTGANDQFIRGLFCNPQVMGAIAGLPLEPAGGAPGGTLQVGSFTVPDVNISVATHNWFSLASRTMWMTYDLMFGSALMDESAGLLLTSQ